MTQSLILSHSLWRTHLYRVTVGKGGWIFQFIFAALSCRSDGANCACSSTLTWSIWFVMTIAPGATFPPGTSCASSFSSNAFWLRLGISSASGSGVGSFILSMRLNLFELCLSSLLLPYFPYFPYFPYGWFPVGRRLPINSKNSGINDGIHALTTPRLTSKQPHRIGVAIVPRSQDQHGCPMTSYKGTQRGFTGLVLDVDPEH